MNITLAGTKVSMDGHTLAFQKNNLVDSMVITVDTDETWQYKLDVKYPCKDSNGKELYNVIDLTRVGNTCTAILQATMLPFNGKYAMQLRGISGNKVYHTDTFDVWVKYSIDPGKVYDPVPSEFYQIESNITSMNNHPPKPGDNGHWLVWNVAKQEYEESDVPLPEGTLPEVSDSTNGWYLTNDGERVYWAEVQGGSGEGDITAIQVNGIDQPIVDKVAKLTIDKDTVGLGNLDNVRQYSSVNQPPYPVTSVDGSTGDVATLSVKYTKQALTVAQQQQARENIGAGTSNFDGSYDSLTGKPDIPSKTSELENDTGYITATQAPVQSVNGQTGDVVLNAESVGALPSTTKIPSATSDLTNDSGYITAADAPVQSVNGQTGVVQLDIPTALPNPNALTIKTGSTTTTYDGSSAQTVDVPKDDNPLGITGAQAGQIAKITAVDDTGKPTAWSPVDIPSGGSLDAVLYTPQALTDEQKRQARENIEALSNNSVYYTYLPDNHSIDIYKLALSGPIGFITGQGAAGMIPPITVIFGAINRGVIDAFAIDIGGNMYNTSLNLMGMPEPVWTKIEQLRLNNNGALPQQTMASSPTENMQIATKKYVDDHATGGGGETWETINVITLSDAVNTVTISQDSNGNAIALKKLRILVEGSATHTQDLFLNNSRYIRANVVGSAASVGALSAEPFCGKMYCFAVTNNFANYAATDQFANIFSKEITITEIKLIVTNSGTFSAGTKFTIQGVRA